MVNAFLKEPQRNIITRQRITDDGSLRFVVAKVNGNHHPVSISPRNKYLFSEISTEKSIPDFPTRRNWKRDPAVSITTQDGHMKSFQPEKKASQK